jgi:spermidine synthase
MRLEYLSSILTGSGSTAVNKDFKPTSYFNSLIVWSEQIQPVMANALLKLLDVPGSWLWAGLTALILGMLGIFRFTDAGSGFAIPLCVAVVGGAQMVLEIVLLLGFQILEGFVYTELALIISFFMAGTALGAAIPARLSGRIVRPRLWLSVVQGILSLYLIGILMLLFLLQQLVSSSPQATLSAAAIFSLSALAAGILGGLHFALAVRARSNSEAPSTEIGAGLYGLDLAGAAAGALIAVLFLLPAFGLPTTLSALALLTLACALTLLKKQPP